MFMLSMNKYKQKSEEQFGIDFLKSATFRSISPSTGYLIKELETMHGRPDAVVIGSDKSALNAPVWRAAALSPSTITFSKVLITMKASRRSMSIEDVSISTGTSYAASRQTINALINEGLASYLKNGKLKLSAKAYIPHTEIVSIEFKLSDWRKALRQAARHRSFADRAYVVMPMNKKALLESNISMFSSFGISVIVYDYETQTSEVIHDARKTKKLSEFSYVDVLGRVFTNKNALSPIT